MNINLKDLSLTDLKALAYDQLANLENAQINLKAINEEIRVKNTQSNSKPEDESQEAK